MDSHTEELAAASKLAGSPRVRNSIKWVALWVVWPVLTAGGGWVVAKLDTAEEIRAVRANVMALTTANSELVARIDALVKEPDGSLAAIRLQQRAQWREILACETAVYAYEPEQRRRLKFTAAKDKADAFTSMIADPTVHPAVAYEALKMKVATP